MSTLYTTLPIEIKDATLRDTPRDVILANALIGIGYQLGVNIFNHSAEEAYAGSRDGRNSRLFEITIKEIIE